MRDTTDYGLHESRVCVCVILADGGRHRFKVVRENGRFPSKFGVRPSSLRGYLFLLEKLDYESGTDVGSFHYSMNNYLSFAHFFLSDLLHVFRLRCLIASYDVFVISCSGIFDEFNFFQIQYPTSMHDG